MSIGSALGSVFEHFSIGMTTGMLFGMATVMCFDKSSKDDDENDENDENDDD